MVAILQALKRKQCYLFFLLFHFQFVSGDMFAQSANDAMQGLMKETGSVGMSVAVVKKGKLIFTGAYGYRDVENKKPLDSKHIFRIASISKSFTATSIMQLVDAGKVNLDEDVSNLIGFTVRNPKFPDKIISLRLMLSHLSSINDSEGYFNLDIIDPNKNPNWMKAYSEYAPRDSFLYCNLNYNMVGAILERASQQRFDDYVIQRVLKPLSLYGGYDVTKLDSTRFAYIYEYNTDSKKYTRSAGAYAVRSELKDGYQLGRTTPVFSPTGGMKISAPDLAKYMMMHMRMGKYKGGRLLSKKNAMLMQEPVSIKEPYGFALETSTAMIPGETLIGHTGVAYGLYSAMFFHPDKEYGIVVIINGCPPEYEAGYNAVIRKAVNRLYTTLIQ
jgi:CubicO group peptidase (beta-lactamase class C family)